MFEQMAKVVTNDIDGDEAGNEWKIHFVLYRVQEDDEPIRYEIYEDDGKGNGKLVCTGTNRNAMRSLILRLGEFVEWGVNG